ncbi:hypothetical protein HOK31_23695 [Candidatus Poribacteria bacterium]|nr:hypothetical protein [Candidatus Poribacteria bacterium]MBT7099633.1 hypothetical protein [Candidatus Poribacteria bacterium]
MSEATGWQFRPADTPDMDNPHIERYAAGVVESIEAGLPVPAYVGGWNVGVIYGYEGDGSTTLARGYFGGEDPRSVALKDMPPFFVFLGGYDDPPADMDVLRRTLEIAVEHWREDGGAWNETKYVHGKAAYDRWLAALDDVDSIPVDDLAGFRHVSMWTYETLFNAREAAGQFLRSQAPVLDGEARDAVTRAADFYEEEHALLMESLGQGSA